MGETQISKNRIPLLHANVFYWLILQFKPSIMSKHFAELFYMYKDAVVPKYPVKIRGYLIPPGVIYKGIDLKAYQDKYLNVECENGIHEIKGFFQFNPL